MYKPHIHEFQQTALNAAPIQTIKDNLLLLLEFVASVFALIPEVFIRVRMGRRYFSVFGVGGSYFSTWIVYLVSSFFLSLVHRDTPFSSFTIDPLGLSQGQQPPTAPEPTTSPENLYLTLYLFVLVALIQKLLCYWRKLMHKEPAMAAYGGESIFSFVLDWIPDGLLKHVAWSTDDAAKRFVEPLAVYLIGHFLAGFDELVGGMLIWCSLALLIRAWCCRLRFQYALDQVNDTQHYSKHLFGALDSTRDGQRKPATARLS
jgi:hypothetical protein